MAVNKDPFCHCLVGNDPDMFLGLVQAGATQAIKVGEICVYNKTSGYWVPASAVADGTLYPIAISAEEQKATGRGELTGARYIKFYSCSPNDVFEFELAAARSLAIGDKFTLTASNSQKLTYTAGDFAVAVNVDFGHYPQEEDTTIRNQSYARVTFNEACSYFGLTKSLVMSSGRKVISLAASTTLKENQMYNSLIIVTAAATITLPPVAPGMDIIVVSEGANAVSVDPDDADLIRLTGAQLDDGDKLTSNSAAGDAVQLITESAAGFTAFIIEGAWTDGGA